MALKANQVCHRGMEFLGWAYAKVKPCTLCWEVPPRLQDRTCSSKDQDMICLCPGFSPGKGVWAGQECSSRLVVLLPWGGCSRSFPRVSCVGLSRNTEQLQGGR